MLLEAQQKKLEQLLKQKHVEIGKKEELTVLSSSSHINTEPTYSNGSTVSGDFYSFRDKVKEKFRIKNLKRSYDTPEPTKRFSVTEVSDCLFKVLLRRLSKNLGQFYKVSVNGNLFSDLYMNQGTAIHKTVTDVVEELCKETNLTLISEKYYYDEDLELGGKPDIYIPELSLLIEIKSGNPETGTSTLDPSGLSYKIQLYLLIYLLRKHHGDSQLTKAYLWFLPRDVVHEVEWNESHLQNYIKRFLLMKQVLKEVQDLDSESLLQILRNKVDVVRLLTENVFCKYCTVPHTCKLILGDHQVPTQPVVKPKLTLL